MDDGGGYDGWTEHTITVTPSFRGFDLTISGRDRNDIKDYLHQTFDHVLSAHYRDDLREESAEWVTAVETVKRSLA
jgi:hypothetical protein